MLRLSLLSAVLATACAGAPEKATTPRHGELSPMPAVPADADVAHISERGEDVPSLEAYLSPGKVTVFDFYATWCAPCRKIERHMRGLLAARGDIAVRKVNVGTWETPVARRYLSEVPRLPYVVVYGKSGNRVATISGVDLAALDAAIAKGAAQ